jgi:hypothetical protein
MGGGGITAWIVRMIAVRSQLRAPDDYLQLIW